MTNNTQSYKRFHTTSILPHLLRQLQAEGAVGGDLDDVVQLPRFLVPFGDQLQQQRRLAAAAAGRTNDMLQLRYWCSHEHSAAFPSGSPRPPPRPVSRSISPSFCLSLEVKQRANNRCGVPPGRDAAACPSDSPSLSLQVNAQSKRRTCAS